MNTLSEFKYWVFDMDGTLTQAVHDFKAIYEALSIPWDADILTYLDQLPEPEKHAKHEWLMSHERSLAIKAVAAKGAVDLVKHLSTQGCQLALLTRNNKELAYITLNAIGLNDRFEHVLGRDEALPKPDPDGLYKIMALWHIKPKQCLMIGDTDYDLACGKAAGMQSILVNQPYNKWSDLTDMYYSNCQLLLDDLTS